MGKRRVWISAGAVFLLLTLGIAGMRAWRSHANADARYAQPPQSGGSVEAKGRAKRAATRAAPVEQAAADGARTQAAGARLPPWKQDGRSDEEVLANYTQEELEQSGFTSQSMFYRQQAMAIADVLPLVATTDDKELLQYVRMVAQGLSFAAMPGIKSDPAKVLQAQRDLYARLRRDLAGKLSEPVYEHGPTFADWLKKGHENLEKAAAGRGPSTADALRRAEWDYSHNGDKKHAKDEDESDVKPGERPPSPYDDDEEEDDGNIYAPISPAIERSLRKQAAKDQD